MKSGYSFQKDTKFITHGWLANGNSDTCVNITNAFLKVEDVNVIVVDWGRIARNIIYPVPMISVKDVADYYVKFINTILIYGGAADKMHLIGHSLGAHISGYAARKVFRGKIKRVTGILQS